MALRARYASMVSSASLTSKVRTLPPARTRTVRSWTRNGTPRPTAPGRPTRRHAPAVPAAPGSATTTEPPRSRCTSAACPSTMAGRPTTHSAISMRRSSTSRACNRAFCWRRGRWRASRPNGGARRRCSWWAAPASRASTTASRSRPFRPWADPRPRWVRSGRRRHNGRWAENWQPPAMSRCTTSRWAPSPRWLPSASLPPPACSRPRGRMAARAHRSMSLTAPWMATATRSVCGWMPRTPRAQ